MEVLYLDSLFGLNLLIDYCILLASARVCGVVLRRGRYALGALLGAVYAATMVLPGFAWLGNTAVKLCLGMAMGLIAFGGEQRLWRCTAVFFAVSALFGGAVYAASLLAGADPLGGSVVSVSGRVLALSFAVCYTGVSLVFRRQTKKAERVIRPVTLTLADSSVTLRGLRDSGNALHDPASGRAAAVADRTVLLALLGVSELSRDPVAALETLSDQPGQFRLLPYRAVGVDAGMLLAFRPDRAEVDGRTEDWLVAISPAPLSAQGEFEVILPPN